MGRARLIVAAVVLLTAITGCGGDPAPAPTPSETRTALPTPTATPTPDPAPPALADLVVSPEGLGSLVIGSAPSTDPATAMIVFDDDVCVAPEFGIEAGDPLAGGWAPIALYGDGGVTAGPGGSAAFQVYVGASGTLERIDVRDSRIPTNGGVRVGDPAAAVLTAHPDAALVVSSDFADVYRVTGSAGYLDIEVKVERGDFVGYWNGEADTVGFIRVVPIGTAEFGVSGSDNTIFGCNWSP